MSSRSLIACSFCLLLTLSMPFSLAAVDETDSPVPKTLTILSYNIKHGYGMDGKIDLSRSAALINEWKPDLVALQEIDRGTERTGQVDQASELATQTEMHAAFGPFFDYQGGEYGMAILAKGDIQSSENYRLPDGREPRSALAIRVIPIEGGPELVFVGIHLYATQEERLAQASRLLELLEAEERPVILAGDFNSSPDGEVLQLFGDEWEVPNKGVDRFTFPSDVPRREIDFILFRNLEGWEVELIDVIDEPLVSDHRPVLLRLRQVQP